jgi:TRAP-type C4-dicarboxylate transport system permease small subunit
VKKPGAARESRRQAGVSVMEHGHIVGATLALPEPASGWRKVVVSVSQALKPVVAIPAALLVVAEVIVLFVGIISRYVLHAPLVWSDELASILFLWLAMLGSVVAFQRAEHMRMTAVVGIVRPEARLFLDLFATAASLAFLLLVVHPAYEFAADEVYVTTPALGIVNTWCAAALPVGIGLC